VRKDPWKKERMFAKRSLKKVPTFIFVCNELEKSQEEVKRSVETHYFIIFLICFLIQYDYSLLEVDKIKKERSASLLKVDKE
jgi:hypothetical protein